MYTRFSQCNIYLGIYFELFGNRIDFQAHTHTKSDQLATKIAMLILFDEMIFQIEHPVDMKFNSRFERQNL